MKTTTIKQLILGCAFLGIFISNSSFADNARKLLDQNCTKCHGNQVYTRANHKMHSLPQLKTQVKRCMTPGNASWFEDETEEVVQYLNKTFYKF